jgi:predicted glutamine amidotransferase
MTEQQTNCHPFRHGRWLFVHNGFIGAFAAIECDLVLTTDESLYPEIEGRTDIEVLFNLAPVLGPENDPPDAVSRALGLVEMSGERRGVNRPFQGTIATSAGERLWAFRYSTERKSRSLFFSREIRTLRALHTDRQILKDLSDDARIIVSESIGDLPGAWTEVPEASYGVVGDGEDRLLPFKAKLPPKAAATP